MLQPSAISFVLNLGSFCLLVALTTFAVVEPAIGNVDGSLHSTYYVVPDASISALFGGAMVLQASGLVFQFRTLKKGGQ